MNILKKVKFEIIHLFVNERGRKFLDQEFLFYETLEIIFTKAKHFKTITAIFVAGIPNMVSNSCGGFGIVFSRYIGPPGNS